MMTTIGSILYLAFAGGDYLLQLSPTYQEMRTRLGELERTEAHHRRILEKWPGRAHEWVAEEPSGTP